MTSSNDGPLLTGPVRAYKDHKAEQIIIETTKDNPAGYGLVVCTLDLFSIGEARVIVAIPDILRGLEPFAALGRRLAGGWRRAADYGRLREAGYHRRGFAAGGGGLREGVPAGRAGAGEAEAAWAEEAVQAEGALRHEHHDGDIVLGAACNE